MKKRNNYKHTYVFNVKVIIFENDENNFKILRGTTENSNRANDTLKGNFDFDVSCGESIVLETNVEQFCTTNQKYNTHGYEFDMINFPRAYKVFPQTLTQLLYFLNKSNDDFSDSFAFNLNMINIKKRGNFEYDFTNSFEKYCEKYDDDTVKNILLESDLLMGSDNFKEINTIGVTQLVNYYLDINLVKKIELFLNEYGYECKNTKSITSIAKTYKTLSIDAIKKNPWGFAKIIGPDVAVKIFNDVNDEGLYENHLLTFYEGVAYYILCNIEEEWQYTTISVERMYNAIMKNISMLSDFKKDMTIDKHEFIGLLKYSKLVKIYENTGELFVSRNYIYIAEQRISRLVENNAIQDKVIKLPKFYNKGQQKAIMSAINNDISIITGFAGTGKTTVLKEIVKHVKNPVCLAPTGKASNRMAETLINSSNIDNKNIKTIHSLIMSNGINFSRYTNLNFIKQFELLFGPVTIAQNKKLDKIREKGENYTYIIDEFSMVDSTIFYLFLYSSYQQGDKVIILGDEKQLPSVSAGALLRDLIKCGFPTARLTEVMRQDKSKADLAKFVTDIALEQQPDISFENKSNALNIVKHNNKTKYNVVDEFLMSIQNSDIKKSVILAPLNNDIKFFNAQVQSRININSPEIEFQKKKFKVGDRIINLSSNNSNEDGSDDCEKEIYEMLKDNLVFDELLKLGFVSNYDEKRALQNVLSFTNYFDKKYMLECIPNFQSKLTNGSMGEVINAFVVEGINKNKKKENIHIIIAKFDEFTTPIIFFKKEINKLDLAYAITVHKAQGSEYENVFFYINPYAKRMLNHGLIYTGISRAQSKLNLYIESDSFIKGLNNMEHRNRETTLKK